MDTLKVSLGTITDKLACDTEIAATAFAGAGWAPVVVEDEFQGEPFTRPARAGVYQLWERL
jgi:hypothetical protein